MVTQKIFQFSIAVLSLVFLQSCKKDIDSKNHKTETIACDSKFTEFNIGNSGTAIKVYSAFTPNNYLFYDEIGDEESGRFRGRPIVISEDFQDTTETGRTNDDSVFNDDINAYFLIENIESFHYNKVYFMAENDSLLTPAYYNYKNSKGTIFDGRVTKKVQIDGVTKYYPKYIESGKYKYAIVIFEDAELTTIVDSISGYFQIVRNEDYKTIGCAGAQENDPLLDN